MRLETAGIVQSDARCKFNMIWTNGREVGHDGGRASGYLPTRLTAEKLVWIGERR